MKPYSREAFLNFVVDNDVVGFFKSPITLKSGKKSHWYVNWRTITNDAYLLDQLTNFTVAYLSTKTFDTLFGVPEGATKTALLSAFKLARQSDQFKPQSHVLSMGRAKPKEHGAPTDRFFIGAPRGKTLVLEDTTTTGGSLMDCLHHLKLCDIELVGTLGLTNRSEIRSDGRTVEAAIREDFQLPYEAMSEAKDLLPLAVKKQKPPREIIEAVQNETGLTLLP